MDDVRLKALFCVVQGAYRRVLEGDRGREERAAGRGVLARARSSSDVGREDCAQRQVRVVCGSWSSVWELTM